MARATAHPDRRLLSSEDVQGTDVYGIGDESIGEIDHLLIDKISGRVVYAVMSFGGFLDLGHSHYPIPWPALKYDTQAWRLPNRHHRRHDRTPCSRLLCESSSGRSLGTDIRGANPRLGATPPAHVRLLVLGCPHVRALPRQPNDQTSAAASRCRSFRSLAGSVRGDGPGDLPAQGRGAFR